MWDSRMFIGGLVAVFAFVRSTLVQRLFPILNTLKAVLLDDARVIGRNESGSASVWMQDAKIAAA